MINTILGKKVCQAQKFKQKYRQTLFFKIINSKKITHYLLRINPIKPDGSPKWKSRGGLQNRCVS